MKIKQRGRAVTSGDALHIEIALTKLHLARTHLRNAGANKSADYVARAIKSTQGALNNARRMLDKQDRATGEHARMLIERDRPAEGANKCPECDGGRWYDASHGCSRKCANCAGTGAA